MSLLDDIQGLPAQFRKLKALLRNQESRIQQTDALLAALTGANAPSSWGLNLGPRIPCGLFFGGRDTTENAVLIDPTIVIASAYTGEPYDDGIFYEYDRDFMTSLLATAIAGEQGSERLNPRQSLEYFDFRTMRDWTDEVRAGSGGVVDRGDIVLSIPGHIFPVGVTGGYLTIADVDGFMTQGNQGAFVSFPFTVAAEDAVVLTQAAGNFADLFTAGGDLQSGLFVKCPQILQRQVGDLSSLSVAANYFVGVDLRGYPRYNYWND